MSELDDAIARLEQAVARLEAASSRPGPVGDEARAAAAAAVAQTMAARLDAALAKLGQLLERED